MAETGSGSGLQFLSAGSVESLYVGSTYELKLGSVNEIMVGAEAKINAAVSSSFSLEAEMAYKAGCGVEWSNVGGYRIEQGEVFELKEESSQFATKELKFQAARTLPAVGAGVPLDAIRSQIKVLLLTLAGINLAIGAAEGAALGTNSLGETENRPNEEGVEQDGWAAGVVGLESSAITALSSMLGYAILNDSIKALMKVYEALPAVSTVTLGEEGITQQANFTATASLLDMSATGVDIKSGLGSVALTGTGDLSSLSLGAEGVTVLAGKMEATVKSPGAVRVGQVSDVGTTSGLTATEVLVELNNGAASAVSLEPAGVEIKSTEIFIHSGSSAFSADVAAVSMNCGPSSSVSATAATLEMKSGGAGVMLDAAGVSIFGPLIQLG